MFVRPSPFRPPLDVGARHEKSENMEATRFLPLLGRILIGLVFLVSGLGKLASFGLTTAYISSVGLPLPQLGWLIAVVLEVGGGLLLILGFRVREVAIGRTNKEIARSLYVAETTVKSHVRAILDKLGVQSRTQAALQALRSEMFSPDELQAA